MKMVRVDLLAEGRSDIASKVRAYRGGYSREVTQDQSHVHDIMNLTRLQDRRAIEAEAFAGDLLGIVATNALELGVDIGSRAHPSVHFTMSRSYHSDHDSGCCHLAGVPIQSRELCAISP